MLGVYSYMSSVHVFSHISVHGGWATCCASPATGYLGTGEASYLSEAAPGAVQAGDGQTYTCPVCGIGIEVHFRTMAYYSLLILFQIAGP